MAQTVRAAPITVTAAAAAHIRRLLDRHGKPVAGVRLGVLNTGCSGMSYNMEFAESVDPADEVVEAHGVRVYVDPKAVMFVLGTEMDFEKKQLHEGFVFRNPNEKSRCGCGESFHV